MPDEYHATDSESAAHIFRNLDSVIGHAIKRYVGGEPGAGRKCQPGSPLVPLNHGEIVFPWAKDCGFSRQTRARAAMHEQYDRVRLVFPANADPLLDAANSDIAAVADCVVAIQRQERFKLVPAIRVAKPGLRKLWL